MGVEITSNTFQQRLDFSGHDACKSLSVLITLLNKFTFIPPSKQNKVLQDVCWQVYVYPWGFLLIESPVHPYPPPPSRRKRIPHSYPSLENTPFRGLWTKTRQIWGIWKLRPAYSPETPNLGQNRRCFVPCDLEIWWMTLENNRSSLLCCFKLCATFHSHRWIQTGVTVRKRPIWVKFDDF